MERLEKQQGELLLVLVTAPNMEVAEKISRGVIESSLAACVNIVSGVRSLYRWEGKIEDASEVLLLVKTRTQYFKKLEDAIRSLHPYEVPEVVAFKSDNVSERYLAWLLSETGPS